MNIDEFGASENMIVAEWLEECPFNNDECEVRYKCSGGHFYTMRNYKRHVIVSTKRKSTEKRLFNANFDIKTIFYYEFPATISTPVCPWRSVCMAGNENLQFCPLGEDYVHAVHLPIKVDLVVPTNLALILQRSAHGPKSAAALPFIFSLSNPYGEILPVILKNRDSLNSCHYAWNNSETTVIAALLNFNLIMCYSPEDKIHSLHLVKKAKKSEWIDAATKAESILSLSNLQTPLACKVQPTTPRIIPSSISKLRCTNDESLCITPKSTSIRTRSMTAAAALVQSLPYMTSSPAQRSSLNRSYRDSAIYRNRRGGKHNSSSFLSSMRNSSLNDESIASAIESRGAELDMLAPEVCFECIWVESYKRNEERNSNARAVDAFFTTDFVGQYFICYFIKEYSVLRCLKFKPNDEHLFTFGSLSAIPCLGAANSVGKRLMAILDLDRNVVLYSGTVRIGLLYAELTPSADLFSSFTQEYNEKQTCVRSVSLCSPVASIQNCYKRHFVLQANNGKYYVCKVPPITVSSLVSHCIYNITGQLASEKALKLISAWYLANNWCFLRDYRRSCVLLEMVLFIRFVFLQCGLRIENLSLFDKINMIKCCDIAGSGEKKQRLEKMDCLAWKHDLLDWFTTKDPLFDESSSYSAEISSTAPLFSQSYYIFLGLHFTYEGVKLDVRQSSLLSHIALALYAFAKSFKLPSYINYYLKDFNALSDHVLTQSLEDMHECSSSIISSRFPFDRIPSYSENLLRLCSNEMFSNSLPLRSFFPVLLIIAMGLKRITSLTVVQKFFGKNYEKKFEFSRAMVRRMENIILNRKPTSKKCEELCVLFHINRNNLLDFPSSISLMLCELIYCKTTNSLGLLSNNMNDKCRTFPREEEVEAIFRLRWKNDQRGINALEMLNSERPTMIPANSDMSLSDAIQRESMEQLLCAVVMRNITQCFGRAAIDLRSSSCSVDHVLPVPTLCLSGKVYPSNAQIDIPQSELTKTICEWGAFYNGIAASLHLGTIDETNVDGEWLTMNANIRTACWAGVIYGFGLNGHISNMNFFTIHELLSSDNYLVSIAILLGYATAKRGSADVQLYKMILTHLPFMMGPTLLELHIDYIVQMSALISLGLLFAQTSHMGVLAKLMNEIGRTASPNQEPSTDRYSYTLSAGIAVGLISLGKGEEFAKNTPFVEKNPSIPTRLVTLMNGGLRSKCVFPTEVTSDFFPTVITGVQTVQSPQQRSNYTKESDHVNSHLTGPAATVALGLMYLRTGNSWAAENLKIPDSLYMIEAIRPDLVLLRTLCSHLVLWDEIRATIGWVESSVPNTVCTCKIRVFDKSYEDNIIDYETIAQSYLCVVAGSCFAMALRFASTFNASAFSTIMHYINIVLPDGKRASAAERLATAAGRNICALALNSLIYSLAIVMAGSGNLQVIRMCRYLRSQIRKPNVFRDNTTYSVQVAAHTAIGLLFLGRGRFALSTSDMAIAAMVIAFFPVCPHNIIDNRMYLQPLRFLWTIAAERRLLILFDGNSSKYLNADVTVTFKEGCSSSRSSVTLRTPCIIPELHLLEKVQFHASYLEKRTFNISLPVDVQFLEGLFNSLHGKLNIAFNDKKQVDEREESKRKESEKTSASNTSAGDFTIDQDFSSRFNISNMSAVPQEYLKERSGWTQMVADSYDIQTKYFNLNHESMAANIFHYAFVKDFLSSDSLRFPQSLLLQMEAFLEKFKQSAKPFCSTSVISSQVIRALKQRSNYL